MSEPLYAIVINETQRARIEKALLALEAVDPPCREVGNPAYDPNLEYLAGMMEHLMLYPGENHFTL